MRFKTVNRLIEFIKRLSPHEHSIDTQIQKKINQIKKNRPIGGSSNEERANIFMALSHTRTHPTNSSFFHLLDMHLWHHSILLTHFVCHRTEHDDLNFENIFNLFSIVTTIGTSEREWEATQNDQRLEIAWIRFPFCHCFLHSSSFPFPVVELSGNEIIHKNI